jgi:outer membrane scaffolding protein for murein synthesis (MipA/OmpV family)
LNFWIFGQGALAAQQPRYELGAAGGAFYLPDYPGADQSHARALILPYFIYRGEVIRADREGGLRGRFLKRERIEGDLSFNAAFNARSHDNDAREGMPNLDWIGEVGPRLSYYFIRDQNNRFKFSVPVRYVFSANVLSWRLRAASRGFTFNPELGYVRRLADSTTMLSSYLGGTWATEKLMDYFYQVDAPYASSGRAQFDARPGYMMTDAGITLIKTFMKKQLALFAGVSWQFYDGSANVDGPLLRERTTETYAVGLAWSMYQSKESVESAEIAVGE